MRDKVKQKQRQNESYFRNKEKVRERSRRGLKIGRIILSIIKESKPCKDCGKWYPYYVIDFDHLGDKNFNIAKWAVNSLNYTELWKELKKCDLVCSNCHRTRTQMSLEYSENDPRLDTKDIDRILEKLIEYGLSGGSGVESSKLDCESSILS